MSKCACGVYTSYASTLKGVITAPMMDLDACVNCHSRPFNEEAFTTAMKVLGVKRKHIK